MSTITGIETAQASLLLGTCCSITGALTTILAPVSAVVGLSNGALIGITFAPTLYCIQKMKIQSMTAQAISFLAMQTFNAFMTYSLSNSFLAPITFTASLYLTAGVFALSLFLFILCGDNVPHPKPVINPSLAGLKTASPTTV